MDEQKPNKKLKGTVGGGRAIGQKNKVKTETKQSMAQFFESLTAGNYRWRQRVKRILDCESGVTEQDFHKWSLLALDRSLGTPGKHQQENEKRQSLYFVTTTGRYPWQDDDMAEQTRRLVQQKADEERLQLEAAKKADVVIDVTADKGDTDAETLERVEPPPADDPSAYR